MIAILILTLVVLFFTFIILPKPKKLLGENNEWIEFDSIEAYSNHWKLYELKTTKITIPYKDICTKCNVLPVEYDSPALLCGNCWATWMATSEENELNQDIYSETMEIVENSRKQCD